MHDRKVLKFKPLDLESEILTEREVEERLQAVLNSNNVIR